VDRGECSFVTKVRNIEKAGGSLAVIIDDSYENVRDIIMSDDGTGAGIRIPSMLIGRKDGEKLKKFLSTASANVSAQASLAAEFVMNNPDNTVEWALWYTSSNDRALDFVKYF
jgi:tRNA A37 threonylcarbamoyladenosine synthetase subunit TsaC/SUA5/YrdC